MKTDIQISQENKMDIIGNTIIEKALTIIDNIIEKALITTDHITIEIKKDLVKDHLTKKE